MSYEKLKEDTLASFLNVKKMKEDELMELDITKSEVLEDLMRFMVFFEELETKRKEIKKPEYINGLKKIKEYLVVLNKMINTEKR